MGRTRFLSFWSSHPFFTLYLYQYSVITTIPAPYAQPHQCIKHQRHLLTPSCLYLLQGEPYLDEGGQSVGGYGDVFFFFYHVQRTIYKRNMPDSSRCYIKISFFYFFKINCRKFCIIQIWDKYMFNCSFIQNKKIREINLFSRNA